MIPVWFRPWMIWLALVASVGAMLGLQTVRLSNLRAEHADTLRRQAEALAAAEAAARVTETVLRADLDELAARSAKEKEDARQREDALVESVRNGNRRLSIAARCPASPGGDSAAAGHGGAPSPRADLDPAAGEFLVRLAGEGDTAIRERNTCIEAYEAVRQRLNAEPAQ